MFKATFYGPKSTKDDKGKESKKNGVVGSTLIGVDDAAEALKKAHSIVAARKDKGAGISGVKIARQSEGEIKWA